jgi:hypothetical protein
MSTIRILDLRRAGARDTCGAALLAWTLVLTGCGGSDSASSDTAPAEAAVEADETETAAEPAAEGSGGCPLAAADVTAVLGVDVVEGTTACSFRSSGSTFAEVYYTGVSTSAFAADEPTAVDGLGDKAYLGPSKELYVLDGDRGFSIHVLASEIDSGIDGQAAQEELARMVLDRNE